MWKDITVLSWDLRITSRFSCTCSLSLLFLLFYFSPPCLSCYWYLIRLSQACLIAVRNISDDKITVFKQYFKYLHTLSLYILSLKQNSMTTSGDFLYCCGVWHTYALSLTFWEGFLLPLSQPRFMTSASGCILYILFLEDYFLCILLTWILNCVLMCFHMNYCTSFWKCSLLWFSFWNSIHMLLKIELIMLHFWLYNMQWTINCDKSKI